MNRLDILDRLFQGLKFKDATYTESNNTCTLNFLYNPECFKPEDDKKLVILNKCKEYIGEGINYEINFINCPLDKPTIANHIYSTIMNNFPTLSKNFTYDDIKIDVNSMQVDARLRLTPTSYEHAMRLNRDQMLAEKLQDSFLADFNIKFEQKDDEIVVENAIEKNMELMSSIKEAEEKTVYELSEITNIIGKNDFTVANDFSKITTEVENVVICGEVTNFERRSYKRNFTKNGVTKEVERAFFKFTLKCDGKFMYCSIFPKQTDESKGDLIEVGMKVCCYGSFRAYNGKLSFNAVSIARCEYKREDIKSAYKHVNEQYHTIIPQEYVEYEQGLLFEEEVKDMPGEYVVFDLETTGLDATKEEIIEIGACKIKNGKIVETFATFVKPSKHIPKEITELTGIDDSMVKDAPTINYILPDFYKFCDGATIVAQNANFDMSFIWNIGKKLSYNFDHKIMDTMEMARQKLPGLKNYKLGTIVDYLGVVLDNAHRAINDATATAKIFIKLF